MKYIKKEALKEIIDVHGHKIYKRNDNMPGYYVDLDINDDISYKVCQCYCTLEEAIEFVTEIIKNY